MKYAISLPNGHACGDPSSLGEFAALAEASGWDAIFLEDYIVWQGHAEAPAFDPWVALAAMAVKTRTIRLGTMVTPISRRRPWKLARETVSIDQLSAGRLILGIGLGADFYGEYGDFGETTDQRVRGAMLDEGLAVLTQLWSGKECSYQGQHYQLNRVQFLPKPLQQPRIPIWIAGNWPKKKPFRRAAQFDGVYPQMQGRALTPDDCREILGYIQAQRTRTTPFDLVLKGVTSGTDKARDAAHVASFAQAGPTWWLEDFYDYTFEQARQRIHQGPPRF